MRLPSPASSGVSLPRMASAVALTRLISPGGGLVLSSGSEVERSDTITPGKGVELGEERFGDGARRSVSRRDDPDDPC
jgi:hypothetical protein